jgi:sigma-B regulation protein RsbU (phosphoserine phosphatase)
VWDALRANGINLSRHAMVSTTDPGNIWVIQDGENSRTFSVRQGKTGLDVRDEYDPRIDPWYLNAVGIKGVAWTKYPNWDYLGTGGRLVFVIGKDFDGHLTDKVSPSLASAFTSRNIILSVNSPISVEGDRWVLEDENGNHFEIRMENEKLNVYRIDVLTCSEAVLDPEGRLAGVVGSDVSMDTLGSKVIGTPAEFKGYAFLLNERGELIVRENTDTFVPKAGGDIRSRMVAGKIGTEYVVDSATYVAYAPIRSIHAPDGKSFWSVGVSIPEREVTRLADDIQSRLVALWELVLGLFVAMIAVVVFAATRISRGITGPIVALDAGVKRIGNGDLDYRVNVETRDEIGELAGAFNKMAGDVQAYIKNLKETTAEKERFESELRVAHDIQMSFLKKIFPAFPNRDEFSLYAAIKPAREVGGDLYDFALLDDSRVFFYIGDVADKGVPASLIMAITMTLMKRASLQPGLTPAGILSQVNATLSEGNENVMFVTLFLGILNFRTGELAFSNAGHNPPVILSADGDCRFLNLPDGMVLGVMPEGQYLDATVVLERGDAIVTYTDGVTEAMNPKKQLYSEPRLQETVEGLRGRSVEDVVAAIFASVKAHAAGAPQSDDIAVLAVKRS